MKLKKLNEQTIVITGASSGIGLTTARAAARAGARLVLAARSETALRQLADEINNGGGAAIYVVADVGDQAAVARVAEQAVRHFGGFDTWINNAGAGIFGKLADTPVEDMRRLYETNFWGVVYGSLEAAKTLRKTGGAIVNIGSVVGDRIAHLQGIYSSSKHAVKGFTDALRMELEADNAPVSVTLVKPSAINTPFSLNAKNYTDKAMRLPPPVYDPETVAAAILHVCENPRRDITVGGGGKLLASGGVYAPRLTDLVMESGGFAHAQKKPDPAPPIEDNGLDRASERLQERGDYDGLVLKSSLFTAAALRPTLTGAILLGAGLGVAALIGATRKNGKNNQNKTLAAALPDDQPAGALESVHEFYGSMPTGVSVSEENRIFVNYPRWGDPVPFTVAEIVNGRETPFPNAEINKLDLNNPGETFVSVQSIVVDPANRLWILDTGAPKLEAIVAQDAAKLVGIDLTTNQIFKTIHFPPDVVHSTTYLNDIRFDLRHGQDGIAYITDSSDKGANAIIVVDLASGASWRKLNDHVSTKAEQGFAPFVEGRLVMQRKPGKPAEQIKMGADGIAISADGERLFYCPLASRRLYSVSCAALRDPNLSDAEVAATVIDEGEKPASDGLESDADNKIYCTAYESNAIVRRNSPDDFETIVHDPRILWADTMSLAADGYLYFTANQLHRQADYQNGTDRRSKPYSLFRVRIDAEPVRLK